MSRKGYQLFYSFFFWQLHCYLSCRLCNQICRYDALLFQTYRTIRRWFLPNDQELFCQAIFSIPSSWYHPWIFPKDSPESSQFVCPLRFSRAKSGVHMECDHKPTRLLVVKKTLPKTPQSMPEKSAFCFVGHSPWLSFKKFSLSSFPQRRFNRGCGHQNRCGPALPA